jgi:hypothetical protein
VPRPPVVRLKSIQLVYKKPVLKGLKLDLSNADQQQTLGLQAHYLQAYGTDSQLHAVFEMYRAFPPNAQFNVAQRRSRLAGLRGDT